MICHICQEEVIIPVEIICLPCYAPHRIHCNSFVRLCFFCCIQYFQLDKPRRDRDVYCRCLFCSRTSLLYPLSLKKAFRIDMRMIQESTTVDPPCQFCSATFPNQISLLRHLETCPMLPQECPCGHVGVPNDFESHLPDCSLHQFCRPCQRYILKKEWRIHQTFDHESMECAACGRFFHWTKYSHHMQHDCPKRRIVCTLCNQGYCHDAIQEHYKMHEQVIEKELSLIRRYLEKKESALELVHSLQEDDEL